VGSTLDLPAVTPLNSPTPSGAGIPTHEINTEINSHDLTTESSPPFSQLMPDTVAVGPCSSYATLIPDTTGRVGVESANPTLVTHDSTTTSSLPNSTLVPINGIEDPLPVPVDTYDRPILHDMAVKNNEKLAGKNNMATTHDVDDSTKLSQANPLLGLVLETRPISSDVTVDNRPEQPLGFKAARDRLDGNESYMVVNRAQNATLVAAKPVYLDTPDLGRTAQWIADSQSTAPPPNPSRVRYRPTSGSSSSDSSLSPPAMTAHQLGSQPQPRRKPPSSRSSHHTSVSRQSVDFFAMTNRLADTTDNAIQRLLDAQQNQTQLLLEAQQSQSQQQMTQSQQLLDAQQLQSRQQAEAQRLQLEAQRQQLDTVQAHAADSLHLHEQLAQERLHAELAEERLRHVQKVSDLRIQLAEKQTSRQTDSADSPANVTTPDGTEIQGAQKTSKTQVTKLGHQTDVNVTETVSVTPCISTNAKQSVCSARHNLTIIAENEINRDNDDDSSLTDLFQADTMSTGNYADPNLENYFAPGNTSSVANNNVTFAEQICGESNRFTARHAHFGRRLTPYTVYNNHNLYTPTTTNAPSHDHRTITRRAQSGSFADNVPLSGTTQHAHNAFTNDFQSW